MNHKPNFIFSDFILPAFLDQHKYTVIRAGRRSGKTYGAMQWILLQLMKYPWTRGLWVDTVQSNISKYIDRYTRPIMGEFFSWLKIDNQKYIIHFENDSLLDFGSAERPENLEWFEYDFMVLNEAGIILKKEWLWDRTLQPMAKNAQVKIVWTPKGKTGAKYYELSQLCGWDENWIEYHYPAEISPQWTPELLDDIKSTVSPHLWLGEYMAEFVDIYEGSIISQSDIRYYDHISLDDFDTVYMHSDTTHTGKSTSDYSCTVVLWESKKDKNYYVLDFTLKKCDVEEQARIAISLYQKYGSRVKKMTYDEKSNQWFGFWIKKLAREEYGISLPIEELKYPSDKVTHFEPHVPHFRANRVYLPSNNPMINIATDQLLAFPSKWVHDDFVDWLSGVLDNFSNAQSEPTVYFL